MSILGWIAISLSAVVVVVVVLSIGRFDKDADRRILETMEAERETEALVHRLVYGEDADNSAPNSRGTRT